jgi:hypothetical protein
MIPTTPRAKDSYELSNKSVGNIQKGTKAQYKANIVLGNLGNPLYR